MKKVVGILSLYLCFLATNSFGQSIDKNEVRVNPRYNQSAQRQQADEQSCYSNADAQVDRKDRRTLKRTGIGAGAGLVVGKILGKPGLGTAAGAGAGAATGHRKSEKEERQFNESYASCLREKGYDAEVLNE